MLSVANLIDGGMVLLSKKNGFLFVKSAPFSNFVPVFKQTILRNNELQI